MFAGICGDFNPIHTNQVFAESSRFKRRIAHGSLVDSLISTVLGMYMPGAGTICIEKHIRYLKPVFIGDTITAQGQIVSITDKGVAQLETKAVNQNNVVVAAGSATVLLPADD